MGMLDWFKINRKRKIGETITTGTVSGMIEMDPMAPIRVKRFESNATSLSAETRMEVGLNPKMPLRAYASKVPALGQNLMSEWTRAVNTRRQYLQIIDELDRYYLVDRLLEAMTEDVLNPNERGECIEVSSENPQIKEVLDKFMKDVDLNNFVCDVTPDLFRFGEFTVRLEVDENHQNGVTSINDDLNPLGIVALYEKGQPSNFLVMMDGQYQMMPAYAYAHFLIGDHKERIKLEDSFDPDYQINYDKIPDEVKEKIPDYIRVGKPFFYGVVQKIRELMVLEQILVALKLNQITQSKLIAIQVSPGTPSKKIRDLLDDVESIMNSEVAIDVEANQLTVADLLSSAGRFKVIPNFGDGKGHIEALNVRDDAAVDDLLKSANDMRKLIMSAVGCPYTLIFEDTDNQGTNGGEKSKVAELRRFGKYARKLASVQRSLAKGLKQICLTHLVNYNNNEFNATYDDFDIVFTNAMVDLSGIEKLEYDDIKQEMILRKLDLAERLLESPLTQKRCKVENILEFINIALNDLTNGLPLLDIEEDSDEMVVDDEVRGEFLSVAKDNFIQLRKARQEPILTVGSDEEQAEAEEIAQKADQFVLRVKAAFAANHARRRKGLEQETEKVKNKVHPKTPEIASRAIDLFQKRRK